MMNNNETMLALMEQLKTKNPSKFELLNQIMLQNSQQTKPKAQPNAKVKGQINRLLKINNNLKLNTAKLKKQKATLLGHLDFFIALNNEFSKAVGACPCWGLDDTCECQNVGSSISHKKNGGPGTYQVDKEMFNIYVMPSLSDELLASLNAPNHQRIPREA